MTETVQPEWLQGFTPQPNKPPKGWQPGQSGNPKGRPVGSRNKKNVIAEEFEKDGSEVARVVMNAALEGDMQAANMVLQRLSPPLRARAEKVTFELTPDAPLHQQANQVLASVAEGAIDPETGKLLIDCIQSVAGIRAVDELEARLQALEEKQ
ncbi:DUF5681 domain-containing protein [Pseudomonas aeruginosa]|uniref:DUF5681 domain-containing protein n=1 Tax=Pseudomonas aeruginosa TaxID=287 RepID=UPI0003BB2B6B|nr:DUF5681 domain-containing protein [Pseudomonas aeruginosa]ERY94318.1 hypothetical protein Q023_01237 [Pseudomonas aeruginosa BWHPSA010]KSI60095.1 hypothetical protein AO985_03970 [Pseudomonas aeruginosa]MBG5844138.1 hypothetical protein [Pseudomonas aeruginosa]NNB82435.1 hypothetical protein [Pseudomonas aeruginosa]TEG17711.1 hypothetical protein IPC1343_14405 [Pseudomonas aeruginosa]